MSVDTYIVPPFNPTIAVIIDPSIYVAGAQVRLKQGQSQGQGQDSGGVPTAYDLSFVYNSFYPNTDMAGTVNLALPSGGGSYRQKYATLATPNPPPINPVVLTPLPIPTTTVVTDTTALLSFHL